MKLFILLFLCSCAVIPFRKHEQLEPYVEMFEYYSGVPVDMPVIFGVLEDPTVGVCMGFRQPWFTRMVVIDHEYWMQASNCIRKVVMLHELAHCVLDMDHTIKIDMYGLYEPQDIMNPTVLHEFCGDEAYFIDQLFSKRLSPSYSHSF